MSLGEAFFYLAVVVDFAFLSVDEQNLARLQTSFFGYLSRIEVHNAHLRSHHHGVVLGYGVARRAQTVAVEHTSGVASVAEKKRGGAVPRFVENGVVFVESLQILRNGVLVVEALGHHHRHGMGQRETAHHEELEHIVQTCRVAHVGLHHRRNLADVAQGLARQHRLTRTKPKAVASDCVYLAVVGKKAERLGQTPCWEGVGGEARMHKRKPRSEVIVGKVGIILSHLHARQHALVDDVAARQRAYIKVAVAHAAFNFLPYYI